MAAEVEAIIDGRDPVEVTPADFPALENGFSQATRNSSQDALNVVAAKLPTFLGGSADLAHSNMTYIKTDGLQDDSNRLNRNISLVFVNLPGNNLERDGPSRWTSSIRWNFLRLL